MTSPIISLAGSSSQRDQERSTHGNGGFPVVVVGGVDGRHEQKCCHPNPLKRSLDPRPPMLIHLRPPTGEVAAADALQHSIRR
jgi:hypothetical protein